MVAIDPAVQWRRTLRAVGAVAVVAGARGVVLGAAEVPGPGPVSAPVDSEYRFYAAWYPIAGVALLRASSGRSLDGYVVPGTATAMLLAATGRALAWRRRGRPHWSQVALLAVEVGVGASLLGGGRRR